MIVFATLTSSFAWCAPKSSSPRIVLSIDHGWRFHLGDLDGMASTSGRNGWRPIDLPHTWNNLDGQDGGNSYYRGVGWYRLHLRPSPNLTEKSLFLRFGGVGTVADVFVNGNWVGEHRGNFGAFCFDVTRWLNPQKDNLIAVRADNSYNPDIAPLSGDFDIDGGIYRSVELLALDPISITPLDDGSSGVYVRQDRISQAEAELTIVAKLRSQEAGSHHLLVRCLVRTRGGKLIAGKQVSADIRGEGTVSLPFRILRPHLWNGVRDPYMYSVEVDVLRKGKLVDRVVQPTGFRFFRVDPNKGFLLNGKPYSLHGVNKHQDRLNKGWACSDGDYEEDSQIMRELGATCVRMAHYQHSAIEYDLCDRKGMVVWAELPLVNKLGYTHAFDENARQQLRELIKQGFNHPSICFWSLFNELSFPSGSKNPADWSLIGQLNKVAHRLDPSRLTTAASNLPVAHPVNFITDVIGLNRYYGWYGGKPQDLADDLDRAHRIFPNRCFAVSEYGAGGSIYQHGVGLIQPAPYSKWHPEEWQSHLHEVDWDILSSRHWLWATFLWNMFDFASDGRNEGDTPGRNDKGLVTYDRETRKDAFYFYKANWTRPPFVYIADRRFSPRPEGRADVTVYSNCRSVDLFAGRTALGVRRSRSHVFIWRRVPIGPGSNEFQAIGDGRYRDSVLWKGTPKPRQSSFLLGGAGRLHRPPSYGRRASRTVRKESRSGPPGS